MADNEMVAATLAAALVEVLGEKGLGAAKKKPAAVAVEIYYQCLDELSEAAKKRIKTGVGPL